MGLEGNSNRVVVGTLVFFRFSIKDTSCRVRHVIFGAKSFRGLSSGPEVGFAFIEIF
jgi:hypothetical protein